MAAGERRHPLSPEDGLAMYGEKESGHCGGEEEGEQAVEHGESAHGHGLDAGEVDGGQQPREVLAPAVVGGQRRPAKEDEQDRRPGHGQG